MGTLAVRLETVRDERFPGVVAEVEIGTETTNVLVDFSRSAAPDVRVGEDVTLGMVGTRGEPLELTGRAIFRSEDPFRRRYQFLIGERVGIPWGPGSRRRLASRVRPFPLAPVQVFVQREEGGSSYPATLVDISATGIGLIVPEEAESELFGAWSLLIHLDLPGNDGHHTLLGRVCHRREAQEGTRYGIDFDSERTPRFAHVQDRILAYVTGCQAGWLEALAKLRRAGLDPTG